MLAKVGFQTTACLLAYQTAHYRPASEMCMGRKREISSLGEAPAAVMLEPSEEVVIVQLQLLLKFVKQIITDYNMSTVEIKS